MTTPSGRSYSHAELRAAILGGKVSGIHTISGNPIVLHNDRGQTFVGGRLWSAAPTPVLSPMRVNGRLTAFFVQPTHVIQSGRLINLNNGPRYASQRYWHNRQEAQHDEFWWSYFCASNGFYDFGHPFGWYMPFSSAWYGHELGLAQRNKQLYPQTSIIPDTREAVIPLANRPEACQYRTIDGNTFWSAITVWTIDGSCPSAAHPPVDARYPGSVVFCQVEDANAAKVTVPVDGTVCPQAAPPAETSDDDLTTDP